MWVKWTEEFMLKIFIESRSQTVDIDKNKSCVYVYSIDGFILGSVPFHSRTVYGYQKGMIYFAESPYFYTRTKAKGKPKYIGNIALNSPEC